MRSDDQIIAALRDRWDETADGIVPSHALRQRIEAETIGVSAHRRTRAVLRLRVATLAGAAVVIAAALVLTGVLFDRASPPPAFAVTRMQDGAVSVTLRELNGAAGATARLRELEVRAVVVPVSDGCRTHVDLTYVALQRQPAPTVHVIPSEIPKGTTTIIAAKQIGDDEIEIAFGTTTGAPPSCVAPGARSAGIVNPKGVRVP